MSTKLRLPVIEINELLKSVSDVAALTAYTSDIMENVHFEFGVDRITATVVRAACTIYSVIEYDPSVDEDGIKFLLPFHLMRKLLQLDLGNAELYLLDNVIEYRDERTGANIFVQLEEENLFPTRKEHTGEYQWAVKVEDMKELLEARNFTPDNDNMNQNNEKILLVYKDDKFQSFGYDMKSLMNVRVSNDGIDPEEQEFIFSRSYAHIVAKLLLRTKDEYVYLFKDEKSNVFVSAALWCVIDNTEQLRMGQAVSQYHSAFDRKSHSMVCIINAGEFQRCLKMHDILGYEEVSIRNVLKYFQMDISAEGKLTVINDLSDYGTKGIIPLPTIHVEKPQDVSPKRMYPVHQFMKFIKRIPSTDAITFYPGDTERSPAILEWNNQRIVIMQAMR